MERNISKKKAKTLNNHQKLIAAICLVVVAILVISVTFAWFTNKITLLNGKLTIGQFNYNVTVYNQDKSTELNKDFTTEEDFGTTGSDFTVNNLASGSVFYKLVKVTNRSSFPIKPYTYVSFNIDSQHENVPNYYYLRGYRVTEQVNAASSVSDFIDSYTPPTSTSVAEAAKSFGTANNNAVLLGTVNAGTPSNPQTEYYVVAYAVHNLPNTLVTGYTLNIHPIIAVSQANAPTPETTSSQVFEVDTWQAFKTAIASAGSGDSIWLTDDVTGPVRTNLALTNGVNLNLNGYDLTIHGNLSFTYPANSDMRTLNVPLSSTLRVEGDLIIEAHESPFTIAGSGSSQNIIIGKQGNSSLGKFKAYAGLNATEGTTDPKPNSIDENSGLIISDVQIKKYDGSSLVPADLEIKGSNTMVKLTSGAVLNSVTTSNDIENVYLANYGTINSVNFAGMGFGSERKVSVYVANHNTINSITIPSGSKGSVSEPANYNTRLINAPGCVTRFSQSVYATNFVLADVEPHSGGGETLENKVVNNGGGKYTVSINTDFGSGEDISTLFTDTYGASSIADCTTMKIETNNAKTLTSSNISNINSNFSNLATLDLSSAALQSSTIPAAAFQNKTSLQNVTFPVTSFSIGANAFAGTSISKVTIPANVTSLGANSFNVASASLEVIWKPASAPTSTQLNAFNVSKTIMFMDASNANAITNPENADYSSAWKLNIYEDYQFKSGDYYCKYTSTGCQIILFAGSLSDYNTNNVNDSRRLIPDELSGGGSDRAVVAVGRQAFKKAIVADNGSSRVNLIFPVTCTTVENYAFEASSSSVLYSNILTLNNVSSIGDSAFRYNEIATSTARPSNFTGMTKLGTYAFASSKVHGGCFDLTGVADKTYTPSAGAFEGFVINGSSSSGNPYGTTNPYFSLANSGTIRADLATNMQCYADFNLKGSTEINANAFITCTISTNNATEMDDLTTVIDVRNVSTIGHDAFKGIECGKFMIGNSASVNTDAYEEIIGQTGSCGIKTFVLDGNLCVDNNSTSNNGYYTITSKASGENVQIGTLEITTNTTCIQQGAFAGVVAKTTGTTPKDTFSEEDNVHMQIGAVKAFDSSYTERADHQYEIQSKAFYGVLFTDEVGIYNFEGASEVGDEAFACSSITKLGLGHYVTQIKGPRFIANCNNISVLNIEYLNNNAITELLNSGAAADPTIINSAGIKQSNFTITVPNGNKNSNLLAYIDDAVWSGWKNYFKPLSRTYRCNYFGYSGSTSSYNCYWEYYVIDPTDSSKGVQIIGFSTTASNLNNGLYIPGTINGIPVTEVGGEGDVFKSLTIDVPCLYFNNMDSLEYVYPDFLDTNKIRDLDYDSSNTANYVVQTGILYRRYTNYDWDDFYPDFEPLELVRALPNPLSAASNVAPFEDIDNEFMATVSVQTEAFKHCTNYTSFTANEMLETIEAGAFDGSGIVNFDFSNTTTIVKIGQNALGECREKQMDSNGYIYYQKRTGFTISVPNSLLSQYQELPAYFMYDKYDCISGVSGGASVNSKAKSNKKVSALKLKEEEFDTTIGGINYRVINNGSKYNGVEYASSKTDFIAVVTSLTAETAQSKTVVIPESIVIDGVTYAVVGIDNDAFGANKTIEKLVLPSSDIVYSSQAFANCSALGYIQFNDVAPYDAAADNAVASLPVASAQSLTENSNKDDEEQ